MTNETAIDSLIAAAICAYPSVLSCKECPLERADGQCRPPKNAEIEQAVRLLKGGRR